MRKAAAACYREERGFTLVELLVAAMLGLVVVGAATTVFVGGIRSEPRTASKVTAIQQARVAVDRITRELRQGWEIAAPASNQLAIDTYVKAATCGGAWANTAIPCQVTYTCTTESCTRVVAQPDGSAPGPSVQVVSGLTTSAVFSYLPSPAEPSYVGVSFSLATESGGPVVLGDGVALRNLDEEEA